jgi:DNA mismatch repair protein MutL
MPKINILPEKVANQIAAGEVIARPASCVKELLENSIDAGAKNITVSIEKAGKKKIEIKDDGTGMGAVDLKNAFLRHATSKIKTIEDLNFIETLGFRGEALASIASVSRVDAMTKSKEDETGSFITIEGGKITREGQKACNIGTIISVRDLFYNTPARLKFLKSDFTEEANIIDVVLNAALSREKISFKLEIDGAESMFFPFNSDLKERIRIAAGREVSDALLEISHFSDNVKVTGYIARPSVTRQSRGPQFLFVNNRCVQSRSVSYAVYEGFGTLLMKGKYPYAYVFIDINPSLVDVNVHPTKAEIKFKDDRYVFNCVKSSVQECLKKNELTPSACFDTGIDGNSVYQTGNDMAKAANEFLANESPRLFNDSTAEYKGPGINKEIHSSTREYLWLRALGQVHKTYIVGEDGENLVVIDQHAAHEKALYEKIMEQIASGPMKVQELLIPEIIEVAPPEKRVILNSLDKFERLGFTIEEFGEREFKISAHPVIIRDKAAAPFVKAMIENLMEKGSADEHDVLKHMCSTMACRAAVKAGDDLNDTEISELLKSYVELKDPHSCPHGRPPIIKIPFDEIEKMFKRKL